MTTSSREQRNDDAAKRRQIEHVYRAESRCVFATLVRVLGSFDLAEEALHEAFLAAVHASAAKAGATD